MASKLPPPPTPKTEPKDTKTPPSPPSLTPHTLRLLKLITTSCDPTSDHTVRAISLLSNIASRSNCVSLWDILARLYSSLTASKEDDDDDDNEDSGNGGGRRRRRRPSKKRRKKASDTSSTDSGELKRRETVAMAMEHVARYIPPIDQRNFLRETHSRGGGDDETRNNDGDRSNDENNGKEGSSPSLWLRVEDLLPTPQSSDNTINNTTTLEDQEDWQSLNRLLTEGRLLLSSNVSRYNISSSMNDGTCLYEQESRMISTLDASAVRRNRCDERFLEERVRLQREILARRMGLGGIFRTRWVTGDGDNDGANGEGAHDLGVSDGDLIGDVNVVDEVISGQITEKNVVNQSRKRKRTTRGSNNNDDDDGTSGDKHRKHKGTNRSSKNKKRIKKEDINKNEEDEENGRPTMRTLLLMALQHRPSSSSFSSSWSTAMSHKNPQTLLATDMVYHTFHPSWHVRHGALLGLTAILKSWNTTTSITNTITTPNDNRDGSTQHFGKWPQDILTRCICILALDRFGDYSGPSLASSFSSSATATMATYIGTDKDHCNNHCSSSPDLSVFASSSFLSPPSSLTAPVREAAAKVVSLLLALAPSSSLSLSSERDSCRRILTKLAQHSGADWEVRDGAMRAFCHSAVYLGQPSPGTSATSHGYETIVTVAAKSLVDPSEDVRSAAARTVSSLLHLRFQHRDASAVRSAIVFECAGPTWGALRDVQSVSSCAEDLLGTFAQMVAVDCGVVTQRISGAGGGKEAGTGMETLMNKLLEFLSFNSPTVRLSCLDAIGHIAEPIARSVASVEIFESLTDEGKRKWIEKRNGILQVYFDLLVRLFDSFFDDVSVFVEKGEYDDDDNDDRGGGGNVTGGKSKGKDEGSERNERESWRYALLRSARDRAWNAVLDSIADLTCSSSSSSRPGTRGDEEDTEEILGNATVTILLRLVDTTSPTNSATNDAASKLSGQYSCLLTAIRAFSRFYLRCVIPKPRLAKIFGRTVLAFLRSSKPDVCETGCLLVKDVFVSFSSMTIEGGRGEEEDRTWDECRRTTVDMLYDNTPPPCVVASNYSKTTATVTSMRVSASAAGAIVALSSPSSISDRSLLPSKLTPLVRALVTSIKNEESAVRSDATCHTVVELINVLSETASPSNSNGKVVDKLTETVCSMARIDTLGRGPTTFSPSSEEVGAEGKCTASYYGSTASKKILRLLISHKIPPFATLESSIPTLWHLLSPLTSTNPASIHLPPSLLDAMVLFSSCVSNSLLPNTTTYSQVVSSLLPTTTLLACASPSASLRRHAIVALTRTCLRSPPHSTPTVLRTLLPHLRDEDDDTGRLGACRTLHDLVEGLGVSVCGFVRELLPEVMGRMTDRVEECAGLGSKIFGRLVRVAPLVGAAGEEGVREDGNDGDRKGEGGDRRRMVSDKVVDHLIHGKPLPPCELPDELDASLKENGIKLRKYQREGVTWIRFLKSVGLNGALCDDMGLGKTIQALVGIRMAHHDLTSTDPSAKPVSLVVCPASIVGHWANEVCKVASVNGGRQKAFIYAGPAKKRKRLWKENIDSCDIIVTSYPTLRSDVKTLLTIRYIYAILDEGHLLKNPKTLTAIAARRLRSHHRLVLSGTPIQNHVHELWSIFDYLMPHFLGTSESFGATYARDIGRGTATNASGQEVRRGEKRLRALHQQVLPFVLRREKGTVLEELPEKTITDVPCFMTEVQAELYERIESGVEAKKTMEVLDRYIGREGKNGGDAESGGGEMMGGDMLRSLFHLRLICTHPILVADHLKTLPDGKRKKACLHDGFDEARFDLSGKLLALNDLLRTAGVVHDEMTAADNDQSLLYIDDSSTPHSIDGSYDSLTKCFEDESHSAAVSIQSKTHAPSSKCVVFAQYTQSLDLVETSLFLPHMPSLRYLRLDGRVPPRERSTIVDRFVGDDSVRCLLSTTRVGGLGLNLQVADMVVFLENDWNPYVDLQAMDRVHRIGQTKAVNVYRLVTKGSIEEKIMHVQQVKRAVGEAIVNSENSTMYSMGTDRLLDIFTANDDEGGTMEGGEQNDVNGLELLVNKNTNFLEDALLGDSRT